MGDQKNLILAAVLSFLVIGLWETFVIAPQRAEMERTAQIQAEIAKEQGIDGVPVPVGEGGAAAGVIAVLDREEALDKAPRALINAPRVDGSISLIGGRIDDLNLKDYRVTIDEDAPEVTLLSPRESSTAYYALFGWAGSAASPGPKTEWTQVGGDTLDLGKPVTLEWDNGAGLVFTQQYEIDENFLFTITQSVANSSGEAAALSPYGVIARHGEPETQGMYLLHEGAIGGFDGVTHSLDYDDFEDFELSTAERARVRKFDALDNGWLGITDKYWMTALIPKTHNAFTGAFKLAGREGAPVFSADVRLPTATIAPGATETSVIQLFAGAKQADVLKMYESKLEADSFYDAIDWGWFFFLTKPFFWILNTIYKLVGNFGVAIIILTVLVKTVMFPLAYKSYVSMGRMKKLQPETEKLREKHKDDPQAMQRAMLELYRKEKVNPASGCVPILFQIPVFFALYKVLFVTIEMRHAPFFGWIKDLAAPDPTSMFTLFGLIDWSPPTFLMIGIWPLIMGVTMWLQMQLNPAPPDPIQKKIFAWMPVMFTFLLGSFPAGLVIYWTANNILTIIQQSTIMKSQGAKIELWDNLKGMFSRKKPEG